jgi:polar amino acid transport system permease protein
MIGYLRFLLEGWWVTIWICLSVMAAVIALSLLLGVLRASGKKYLQIPIAIYVQIVRGVPLLVLLLLLYFGLPTIGIPISSFAAAFIGLVLYSSSYVTEIVRGGIDSIPQSQWDAAKGLGLSFLQQVRYIIIPQAVRQMIPPIISFFLALTKGSAIVFVVGYRDLTRSGIIVMERLHAPFLVYGAIAVLYFILCYPLSIGARRLEKRYSVFK